jgi:hypothetical protein
MADHRHNPSLQPWPPGLAWATRFLLLAGLIGAVAWSVQATRSGQAWRVGAQLLQAGHYSAAVTALEDAINLAPPGGGPGYDSALAHLSLSYAYLARRDFTRAAAVLPDARTAPALAALLDLQRARIALARGDSAAAQAHRLAGGQGPVGPLSSTGPPCGGWARPAGRPGRRMPRMYTPRWPRCLPRRTIRIPSAPGCVWRH